MRAMVVWCDDGRSAWLKRPEAKAGRAKKGRACDRGKSRRRLLVMR